MCDGVGRRARETVIKKMFVRRRERCTSTVLAFAAALLVWPNFVQAASQFGTRDEAVAMVHRVQDMFKRSGYDATIKAVLSKSGGTIDRDLYAYILDQN